jgi:hypothetical protein
MYVTQISSVEELNERANKAYEGIVKAKDRMQAL